MRKMLLIDKDSLLVLKVVDGEDGSILMRLLE